MMSGKRNRKDSQVEQAKLLVVDSVPMVRERLRQVLDQDDTLALCGETDNARQALEAAEELLPDLVITGLGLRNSSGIDLVAELQARHAQIRVLVLSSRREPYYVEQALRAGAHGYVAKQEPTHTVIEAIRHVLEGKIYLPPGILNQFVPGAVARSLRSRPSFSALLAPLSRRELRVFDLLGQGYGTAAIASKLRVNLPTVRSYRARIRKKLQLKNHDELLQAALHWRQSWKFEESAH